MKTIRYIMLGGFLGAGKTTTIARLARWYTDRGQKVGIVTNDQAQDLVDTNNLRSQGLTVAEVSGACFCCKFDDLVAQMSNLDRSQHPDIILAEPVGSCTDLVATVIQPMKDLFEARFSVAPYAVLFKPSHGLRILRGQKGGFSPKAEYIFRKQLEEADAIVVNRIDEISAPELAELQTLLAEQFPGIPVLTMSAKTGDGFDALPEFLAREGGFGRRILEIDYDLYAEGEAELGWLNSTLELTSAVSFSLDDFTLRLIERIAATLRTTDSEVAHLKLIGLEDGHFAVANVVSSATAPVLSLASGMHVRHADLIINARVATDPMILESLSHQEALTLGAEMGVAVEFRQSQSLRPGRPTPTHRYPKVEAI